MPSKVEEGVSFVASKAKGLANKVGDLWNKGKTTVKNTFVQADKKLQHAIKTLVEYEWIPGGHAFSMAGGGKAGGSHSLKDAYQYVKETGEKVFRGGGSNTNRTIISSEMEEKLLYGQRKAPPKNDFIGGHSPNINNTHPNYAVEEITVNVDGTRSVKFTTQFSDGNLAKIKSSTLFPSTWSNQQIINSV